MLSTCAPSWPPEAKTIWPPISAWASTPTVSPTRTGAPNVLPPLVEVKTRSPPFGFSSQQVPISTTTWLGDGANTAGVPSRSSPSSGDRVTLLEHLLAPRSRTQTTVFPSPLAIAYATTMAPFDSMAAFAPP